MDATGPNADQIRYWNETAPPKWIGLQRLLDDQLRALGELTMERAAIAACERVIDVGCGCGATSAELARRVGPRGKVLGIDISTPMLACAAELASSLPNARFENADAQTHRFASDAYDLVFSRFGVMFFVDPAAAFANLRSALRPGGRLAFVCWQALSDNPWMLVPLAAAAQHVTLPPPPAPGAPGPFSFADAVRVRGILDDAGFRDVALEDHRQTLAVGGTVDLEEAVGFLLQMGPTGVLLRDVDADVRARVGGAVRQAIEPFLTSGGVRMPSAAWIVTARTAG